MASPSDPEEPVTKLKPIRIRTSLYNKFFLLRLKVVINEQPAQLEADRNGWLTLNCRQPKVGVTFESLLTDVNEILQQHGLHGVSSYWCDEVPLFELKISSHDDLKKLFRLEEKIQEDIASKIEARMVKQKLTVSVKQSIYWLNSAGHYCRVTKENSSLCLDLFSSSGCPNTLQPTRQSSPDGPPTMKQLDTELCEVNDWFILGIQLGVEDHVLQRIEKEKNNDIARCRIDMFSEWLRAGNSNWLNIVEALKNMRKVKLAEKIAKKHGVEYEDETFHKKPTMEDIDEREKAMKQAIQEYQEKILYCKEEIKCLQETIEHLQQELEKALETEKNLQQELENALETERNLQQKLEKSLETEKNLQQELEKSLETEKNLQQELEKGLDTEKNLQQELEKAKEENEQQKQELEAKQTENEHLKQELESKIEKFDFEYSVLKMELRMSEHRYKTQNEEMEILKENNEILKAKIREKIQGPTPARMRCTSSSSAELKSTGLINPQATGPCNEKEDESLPEVIHRGNAVSKMQLAKKPKTTHYGGFHKAQSSLPEITTTVKHQKSERASAINGATAVPQIKPTTYLFPTKPHSWQTPLPEIHYLLKSNEFNAELNQLPGNSFLSTQLKLKWQKKGVPEAILRGTVAVDDSTSTIFLMGQDSSRVHKYDLQNDEWKEVPKQCPHINPGLVFIDGLLTAVGGQKVSYMYESDTNEVVSWDKGKWVRKFPSMQQAHSNPIMLVYRDWVIAIDRNDINKTEIGMKYHSFTFTWSKIELKPPLELHNFTATVCDDNLIFANMYGCAIACEFPLNSTTMTTQSGPSQANQVADQSQQWRVLKSLSKETTVTTFLGDAVCISEDGILYKLILDEGKWVEIEDMKMASYMPVKAPIVCVVKNRLVVIGGVQGEFCTTTVQIGSY